MGFINEDGVRKLSAGLGASPYATYLISMLDGYGPAR